MREKLFLILVVALAFIGCAKQDSISVALDELGKFYNCSTVDWALIDTLYYRPYNCDWPEEIGAQIDRNFPMEYTSKYWHRLQNAKTYLHQQTLPLRIGASDAFIEQLNRTKSALDSLFVRIVSQEFYMRLFVDCYEEIMPQEITKCFERLNISSECSQPNDSYHETIRKIDDIELHFFCLTGWNSCHAYGVEAFRKTGWRKKEWVDIFEFVPELAPFQTSVSGKVAYVKIEIYGITPEILFDEWAESFFFDRTKEDIYLPVFEAPEDLRTIHLIDNTHWEPNFHHYHWNSTYFEYCGIEAITL